jgi:hypothetical protein
MDDMLFKDQYASKIHSTFVNEITRYINIHTIYTFEIEFMQRQLTYCCLTLNSEQLAKKFPP